MSNGVEQLRDGLKARLNEAAAPLCRGLSEHGVTPNQLTVLGLAVVLAAAALLAAGIAPAVAGVVFLLGSLLDALDGALARRSGRSGRRGAFLDSSCDRIQETAILAAIAYRLALEGDAVAVASTALAVGGSLVTSYVKARAEALGVSCATGWVCRPERVALITAGLLFGWLAPLAHVLALLAWLSAVQRLREVLSRLP